MQNFKADIQAIEDLCNAFSHMSEGNPPEIIIGAYAKYGFNTLHNKVSNIDKRIILTADIIAVISFAVFSGERMQDEKKKEKLFDEIRKQYIELIKSIMERESKNEFE